MAKSTRKMRRICRRLATAIAASATAWKAAPACAQVGYTGTVLYSLNSPSNLEPGSASSSWADGGQVVGTGADIVVTGNTTNNYTHALLWSEPGGSVVDLTPPGITVAVAYGTNGNQQVGSGSGPAYNGALLWSGSAASAVELNPAGASASVAQATDGGQQAGREQIDGGSYNAVLWSGTAASAVNLNPSQCYESLAYGVGGSEQVGFGYSNNFAGAHAFLWTGSAASAIDLNPAKASESFALGTNGTQQVGFGIGVNFGNYPAIDAALLWAGTAASAVSLNPAGYTDSQALATNGVEQVGLGRISGSSNQALLWSGTAASAVQLQATFPATDSWITSSQALAIDAAGNVYGTAEGTVNNVSENVAVEWSPIRALLTWNNLGGTGDGQTWDVNNTQNWNNGSPAVFNEYDNVTFNDANNGNYNVTLNSVVAPTSVTFANMKGNYVLSGAGGIGGMSSLIVNGNGTVTLSMSNSYTGPTTINGGTLVIGAATALPADNAVTIGNGTSPASMQLADRVGQMALSSLTINSGGVLDITNNGLVINYAPGASPAAMIRQWLTTGYGNDTWLGPGIDSSAAALNPGRYAVGYADGNVDTGTPAGANQVLVEYTLAGDANLDDTVNFADLLVVAQNFNHSTDVHGNPIDWADGDFNYDGKVNFADLLLIAQNFNQTLSQTQMQQLPASFDAAWNLALADVEDANGNNVPEPKAFTLFAVTIAGLSTSRAAKKRSRRGL